MCVGCRSVHPRAREHGGVRHAGAPRHRVGVWNDHGSEEQQAEEQGDLSSALNLDRAIAVSQRREWRWRLNATLRDGIQGREKPMVEQVMSTIQEMVFLRHRAADGGRFDIEQAPPPVRLRHLAARGALSLRRDSVVGQGGARVWLDEVRPPGERRADENGSVERERGVRRAYATDDARAEESRKRLEADDREPSAGGDAVDDTARCESALACAKHIMVEPKSEVDCLHRTKHAEEDGMALATRVAAKQERTNCARNKQRGCRRHLERPTRLRAG